PTSPRGLDLGNGPVGIYYKRAVELASAHLALACRGLSAFPLQSRWTSLYERIAARRQRSVAVFAPSGCYWVHVEKLDGSCTLRHPSGERGIRRLDCGAQERAQHVVLPDGDAGLWALHT